MGAGFFMHPWRGISFLERKVKAEKMRLWLQLNKHLRFRRGQVRDDGKIFCGYGVGYSNGEQWTTQQVIQNRRKHCNAEYSRKRYHARDDVREKSKLRIKSWAQKNKDRINQRAAKRRALKKSLLHERHDFEAERELHQLAQELTQKTGTEHHVDHIIPIKHGGPHHHLNLQVLPIDVNLGKNSTPFWISTTYKDFRSVSQELWPEQLVDFYLAMRSV